MCPTPLQPYNNLYPQISSLCTHNVPNPLSTHIIIYTQKFPISHCIHNVYNPLSTYITTYTYKFLISLFTQKVLNSPLNQNNNLYPQIYHFPPYLQYAQLPLKNIIINQTVPISFCTHKVPHFLSTHIKIYSQKKPISLCTHNVPNPSHPR